MRKATNKYDAKKQDEAKKNSSLKWCDENACVRTARMFILSTWFALHTILSVDMKWEQASLLLSNWIPSIRDVKAPMKWDGNIVYIFSI